MYLCVRVIQTQIKKQNPCTKRKLYESSYNTHTQHVYGMCCAMLSFSITNTAN